MNDTHFLLLANTVFWVASTILSIMAVIWVAKNVFPLFWLALTAFFRIIRSSYFRVYERSADTSALVKEAKAAWLETRKKNELMFDKKDRSRIRASFLEAEHKELTYYLALKGKASKDEKARLRELRTQIEQVNNA